MKKIKWLKTSRNNIILRAKWGGISYNPDTSKEVGASQITDFMNMMGHEREDGEETALYDQKVWRILEGDFRKEYEELFPNLKKCLAFYESNKSQFGSNYSTDEE